MSAFEVGPHLGDGFLGEEIDDYQQYGKKEEKFLSAHKIEKEAMSLSEFLSDI